ncbi:MAG: hypothetical protein Q9210_003838 [Variospora velana]
MRVLTRQIESDEKPLDRDKRPRCSYVKVEKIRAMVRALGRVAAATLAALVQLQLHCTPRYSMQDTYDPGGTVGRTGIGSLFQSPWWNRIEHGARLDAADKQWHLTSPAPYDPPLTYGGWLQSRALGNRIGSILHARDTENEKAPSSGPAQHKGLEGARGATNDIDGHPVPRSSRYHARKRRHKVIVHSSPFLRCIQTSIAITAGIAEFEASAVFEGRQPLPTKHHVMHSKAQHPIHPASPHLEGGENWNVPHLSAIPEPAGATDGSTEVDKQVEDQFKARLRLDAFLGEWLSPEYFDSITPPPSSVMMLTNAKSDLMFRGEYMDVPAGTFRNGPDRGNFPGGWGSSLPSTHEPSRQQANGPLSTISTIKTSLPRMQRAVSHSNVNGTNPGNSNLVSPKNISKIEVSESPGSTGYVPPTPSYAISPSDPIPPGYVAHARDACVDVDYRWDSMRQPHDWGHGGEYGEEWSAMHKRFRRGLQSMITWYEHNHTSRTTQDIIDGASEEQDAAVDEDTDIDIVLVLVTHGAGCNALIGALTNQPVLLDVGMASLTLAVRKERSTGQTQSPDSAKQRSRRRSTLDSGISDGYEVKIIASTEHLQSRSRSSTVGPPYRSSSHSSSPIPIYRYRTGSMASITSSNSFSDGDYKLDPETRAMTSTGIQEALERNASLSGGLWSKPALKTVDGATDLLHSEKPPPLSGHSPLAREISEEGKPSEGEREYEAGVSQKEKTHGAPGFPTTQSGLWGAPPATASNEREKGFKRRWTHSEHR